MYYNITLSSCQLIFLLLAETVRFELTEHFYSTVFKTVAISQTRPHFHNLVDEVGFEPTMPEAADLQSAGVTNFPTHPYLIVTGTVLQYLHKGTLVLCYLVLHYTKLWCPGGDSNSHTLRYRLLRPTCLPFHHQGITYEQIWCGW